MEKNQNIGLIYAIIHQLKPLRLYTATAALLALISCEHKELCINHLCTAKVNVMFDWRYASEEYPKSSTLCLFSKEKGTQERYDFTNINGGEITNFSGDYTAYCINSNTKSIKYTTNEEKNNGAVTGSNVVFTTASTELLSRLSSISVNAATLSGLAVGLIPVTNVVTDEQVTVLYGMDADFKKT